MTTLREARDKDDLERFIAEREAEQVKPADEAAFNRAVEAMARTSKATPATSKRRNRGG